MDAAANEPAPADLMRLLVSRGAFTGPAIARLVGIGASRAELPLTSVDDALTIADIVADHGAAYLADSDGRLEIALHIRPRSLEIHVGQLRPGGASQLLLTDREPESGASIGQLATSAVPVARAGGEQLVIELADDRNGAVVAPGVALAGAATVEEPPADFAVAGALDPSGVYVVAVRGEVDISTAAHVKRAAREAVYAGSARIVLDLSDTTFLDSTGLGVIIGLARLVRPDGDVAIVNTDPAIAKTFEITGLGDIFKVCASREQAIAAITGSA